MLKCYSYDIVCQEIPDEISLAVNISCGPNRGSGCHSPCLWSDEGELMTEDMLSALIGRYAAAITCLCFMGGDADPTEIQRLAIWVKINFPGLKTAWYSGREQLPDGFDITVMDFIKIGPYIESLGGLNSPATNQVLYRILPDGTKKKIFLSLP